MKAKTSEMYDLADRLYKFTLNADPYEVQDTDFCFDDVLFALSDPPNLKSAINFVKEHDVDDMTDAESILYFGITKKDHKKLLSDLKKRRREIK